MSERETPSLAEVIALLPCPFCGGEPSMFPPTCKKSDKYDARDRAFPEIRCCRVIVQGQDWDQSCRTAIAAWNTRTSAASLRDEDARDAARYRFIREIFDLKFARNTDDYLVMVGELATPDEFFGEGCEQLTMDAAIDAATQPAAQERQA